MLKLLLSSLLTVVVTSKDVIIMQPLRDRYSLKDDVPNIQLKDYVAGSGKEVVLSNLVGLFKMPRVKNVQEIKISGDKCRGTTRTFEDNVALCDQKIHRVDFMTPDEPEKIYEIPSGLKCFDLKFVDLLQGVLVLCQNADSKIVMLKLNHTTMQKEWETNPLELTGLEDMKLKVDESTHTSDKAVIVYSMRRDKPSKILIHSMIITGPKLEDFTVQQSISLENLPPVKSEADLELLSVELCHPRMYVALQHASKTNTSNNEIAFLNCTYPRTSNFFCNAEVPRQEVSKTESYIGELIRDYSGAGGEKIYMIRGRTLHEIDFTQRIVRKTFRIEDSEDKNIDFTGKTAIAGRYVYFVHYMNKALWLYIINIQNNYYNIEKLTDTDEIQKDQLPFINVLFDEHVYGGHRPDIFLLAPGMLKVQAYFTYDWTLGFNTSLAVADPQIQGQSNLNVKLGLTSGVNSKLSIFTLKIIDDPKKLNDFTPPDIWEVYKGSGLQTLNLVKEQFKGDSISVTVNKDSTFQPRLEYTEKIEIRIDKDIPIKDGILHNQGSGYIVAHQQILTFMDCNFKSGETREQLGYLDCKVTFDYTMPENSKLKSILTFDNSYKYVLLTNETSALLIMFYPSGLIAEKQEFKYRTEMIQLRDFNGIIYLEALIEYKGEIVLRYSTSPLGGIPYKETKNFDKFYGKVNPVGIKKGSRKLNSVFIESLENNQLQIYELNYDLSNTISSVTQTSFEISNDVATCYFQEFTTVIEPRSNKMYSVDRDALPTAKRVYPLAEYNIDSIQKVVCDHEHSLVLVHTNDGINNRVVVFRVELSNSEALRRIHSLIQLSDRADDEISSAGGADAETAVLIVYNQRETKIHGYKYQVEVPLVTVQVDENPTPVNSNVSFEFRVVGSDVALKRNINLTAINQDTSVKAEVSSSPPEYLDGTFELDDFITVDGFGAKVRWHNHSTVRQENVKFRQRIERSEDSEKLLPNFKESYSEFMFSRGPVYIAWNNGASSDVHIYDMRIGRDVVFTSKTKGMLHCFIAKDDSNLIICSKALQQANTYQIVVFKKNQKDSWYQESTLINYEIDKFDAYPLDETRYAVAMMDKNKEVLKVYAAENSKRFNANFDRALTITSKYQVNLFTTVKVQNRMVVIKHEGMSNKLNFFEMAFDQRFDSMVITRQYSMDIFGGQEKHGFALPSLLGCYADAQEDQSTDLFCMAIQRGVYSYVAKLNFARVDDPLNLDGASNDFRPTVLFSKKIKNVQGYLNRRLRVYKDWAIVVLEKDSQAKVRAPGMDSQFYLAIYRLSSKYSNPFALLNLSELYGDGLKVEQIQSNMEWALPNKNKLLMTLYLMGEQGRSMVRRYVIGGMQATFTGVKLMKTAKGEGLIFEGLVPQKEQSAFLMSRSIYWKYDTSHAWKSALKLFLITLVVVLLVFIVLFLIQSVHTFQSIGDEEEILREFETGEKDHLDEKVDNAL